MLATLPGGRAPACSRRGRDARGSRRPAHHPGCRGGRPSGPVLLRRGRTLAGTGIADIVASFDPGVVVVGGGVSEAGDLLLASARTAFAAALFGVEHRPGARFAWRPWATTPAWWAPPTWAVG